jgi:hypothetical protein
MVRLTFRGAVGVLLATLVSACLGGQTGQPSSLDCGGTLSASDAWNGTTVQLAAQSFEGTYNAGLQWQVEPRSATSHTPVDFQDSVQLVIAYQGARGSRDCSDQLSVPVSLTLTTSESGIIETSAATLIIERGEQGLAASLHASSVAIVPGVTSIDAALQVAANGAAPQGSFDTSDPNLPGASANFTTGP